MTSLLEQIEKHKCLLVFALGISTSLIPILIIISRLKDL